MHLDLVFMNDDHVISDIIYRDHVLHKGELTIINVFKWINLRGIISKVDYNYTLGVI